MRRRVVLVTLLLLAAPSPARADETIVLVPGGFRPNSVTIRAGERVLWRNDDRVPRGVAGDGDAFSTPLLRPGQSAVVRFDELGTVGFHDARNADLRGAVIVLVRPHVVTIRASATAVAAGGAVVVFSGRVSPARRGEVVQLLRIESDGSVNILDSTTTGRRGSWSLGSAVSSPGVYRARWGRAQSRGVRVRVG